MSTVTVTRGNHEPPVHLTATMWEEDDGQLFVYDDTLLVAQFRPYHWADVVLTPDQIKCQEAPKEPADPDVYPEGHELAGQPRFINGG